MSKKGQMKSKVDSFLISAYESQIEEAFFSIQIKAPLSEIKKIAQFLVQSMSSDTRVYHNPEHSLNVSKPLPPAAKIAALFHDIVYCQIDSSWKEHLYNDLYPFIPDDDLNLNVTQAMNSERDVWISVIAKIFGIDGKVSLRINDGLNEFLSAIVFYKRMKPYLSPMALL